MDLFDFKDRHLRQVRALSQAEFDAFRHAAGRLRRFRRWERALGTVRRNQEELEAGLSKVAQTVAGAATLGDAQDQISEEVNRLLQNYLASFRFYLDLTEFRLKRMYPDRPAIFQAFKDATTAAFDGTLAYRLLYKLRNYAQHCGAPIGYVAVHAAAAAPGQGKVPSPSVRSATLQLDVNELLEQWDGWGPVAADLRAGPPVIEVAPLLGPLWSALEVIRDAVKTAERVALLDDAKIISTMYAPVVAVGGVPVVAVVTPKDDGKAKLDIVMVPADVAQWLGLSYTPVII